MTQQQEIFIKYINNTLCPLQIVPNILTLSQLLGVDLADTLRLIAK